MPVFQVLERPRPQKGDDLANYHLLSRDFDLEKRDETKTCIIWDVVRAHHPPAAPYAPEMSTIIRTCLRKLGILLPSFLHAHASAIQLESKKPRLTAWLDGLRGIAVSFIVLHHMSLIWFSWAIHNGWTNADDHLIQLPIIRLLVSGRANVMLLFVASGYTLSWKPLGLLLKGQRLKMYRVLASSTFRRYPRLFIPAIIICSPVPVITYLGGFAGEGIPDAAIQPLLNEPPRFDSIAGQFLDYLVNIMGFSDVSKPRGLDWIYNDSLWTLPIEFKGSAVLFTLLLALSRCTACSRVVITVCVAFYCLCYFHWGEFLFIGGMLVAETSPHIRGSSAEAAAARSKDNVDVAIKAGGSPPPSQRFGHLYGSVPFLAALFVLSMPEQDRGVATSYSFRTLWTLIPAHFHASGAVDYFWQPIAAVALVLIVDRVYFLQGIFTTRLAQYLGRISCTLYLVHMLILNSLGFYLGRYFLQVTGSESYWQYGTGIDLAGIVVGSVIIWAADLTSRLVDANVVRFTAWAYSRMCKMGAEGRG
ncbi:acyltransferase family-domain-containing protein [Xylaria sp. CBS 124048]|nr:acyltransferase family-domain-containing protein [Xylaria sp. CBS 124048]